MSSSAADSSAPPAAAPASPSPLRGLSALVADDSGTAQRILKGMLERIGMQVTVVEDGAAAIQEVRANPGAYDVALLDVVMERVGGFEAACAIASLPGARPLPTVLMSASIDDALRERCGAAGIRTQFLEKPYRAADVLASVLRALGRDAASEAAASPVAPEGAAELSALTESDLSDALERCGNDGALLASLLRSLQSDAPSRLNAAESAVAAGRFKEAAAGLHRPRGDMLNLGLTSLAERLRAVERELQELASRETPPPAADGTRDEALHARTEAIRKQLVDVGVDLIYVTAELAAKAARLATAVPAAGSLETRNSEAAFGALVGALARGETSPLRRLTDRRRLLPARYPPETDGAFRACLERLDFAGGLALLDPADRALADTEAADDGQYRILVVDDAAPTIRLLGGMLDDMGSVRFACSADDALAIAAAWPPDIVLCDLFMPGKSGIEFCREFKQRPEGAQAVVILISAENNVANEIAALTVGAADFLEKPLNAARVVGRVRAHLASVWRAARSAFENNASQEALGFVTCSLEGSVLEVGPQIVQRLQRPDEALRGQPLRALFEAASEPQVREALRVLKGGGRLPPFEALLATPEPGPTPVRVHGWLAAADKGRVVWLAVQSQAEALALAQRNLERDTTRAIDALAGSIAHEFNNLLNVAIGNLDVLRETLREGAALRRAEQATDALLRAAGISRRLGDLALRTQRASSAPQSLELLLDELWPVLSNTLPKSVLLRREKDGRPAPVALDVRGLRTAVLALLDNAARALPAEGGAVTLRTRVEPEAGYAVLEVLDGGHGMPPEVAKRAFEPFFSTDAPRRPGLGLTQVRSYAESVGGLVELASTPGSGTCVRLKFRLAS